MVVTHSDQVVVTMAGHNLCVVVLTMAVQVVEVKMNPTDNMVNPWQSMVGAPSKVYLWTHLLVHHQTMNDVLKK